MAGRGGVLAAVGLGRAGLDDVHLEHGRTGIQAPDALVREALHRRLAKSEETRDGPLRRRRFHAR